MPVVEYDHQIPYAYDADGHRSPRLSLRIAKAEEPDVTIDIDAYLDSGAERTLFSGRIGAALGIDVVRGPELVFQTATGAGLVATLHQVRIEHPELGSFSLEVAFSTADLYRNLLGRDFFNLIQVGFRERYLALYFRSTP